MSNNEKDEFIRKNLNNDRIIASGDEVKKKIKKDIDVSKIKQKKYTIGERRFMKFLSVVLVVSLASNAYLFKIKTNDAEPDSKTSKSYSASSNVDFPEIKDDIENESKYENVTNEMKNEISQIALIENKNTIRLFEGVSVSKCARERSVRKHDILYYFVKASPLPSSFEAKVKTKKWMWENKEDWKAYMIEVDKYLDSKGACDSVN